MHLEIENSFFLLDKYKNIYKIVLSLLTLPFMNDS